MVQTSKDSRAALVAGLWIVLVAQSAPAQSSNDPDHGDTQLWTEVRFSMPVKNSVDFLVIGGLRAGRNLTDLVNERVGAGVVWRLGKHVELSTIYGRIVWQPVPRQTLHENRFTLDAEFEWPLGRFALAQRNRIDRRLVDGETTTRYRNRVRLTYPLRSFNGGMNIFLSEEVFYDWRLNSWFRNRMAVGVDKPLSKRLLLEIYYLRQNDGMSLPGDIHVIGATLHVSL